MPNCLLPGKAQEETKEGLFFFLTGLLLFFCWRGFYGVKALRQAKIDGDAVIKRLAAECLLSTRFVRYQKDIIYSFLFVGL